MCAGCLIKVEAPVHYHCIALETVLRKGQSGTIYNISGGNELTNQGLVNKILKFMGKPVSLIMHVEDRPGHDVRYSLDDSKIKQELKNVDKNSK